MGTSRRSGPAGAAVGCDTLVRTVDWEECGLPSEDPRVQEAARSTDHARLRDLATHRHTRVRAAVAGNPSTPPDVLTALTDDRHHRPRYGVAENPAPAAVAAAMAAPQADVRVILAQRHDLTEEVETALLADPDVRVAESLLSSTRRAELVTRAAGSPDHRVRAAAARSEACPTTVLDQLSRDPRAEVRVCVVTHASERLTEEQVRRLGLDRSGAVRYALGAHLLGHWEERAPEQGEIP